MNLHKDAPGEQWRKKGASGILAKGRVKSPSSGPLRDHRRARGSSALWGNRTPGAAPVKVGSLVSIGGIVPTQPDGNPQLWAVQGVGRGPFPPSVTNGISFCRLLSPSYFVTDQKVKCSRNIKTVRKTDQQDGCISFRSGFVHLDWDGETSLAHGPGAP